MVTADGAKLLTDWPLGLTATDQVIAVGMRSAASVLTDIERSACRRSERDLHQLDRRNAR